MVCVDPLTAHRELLRRAHDRALLESTAALLSWDEETTMPRAGAAHRAAQHAQLAGMVHAELSDPRIEELVEIARQGAPPGTDRDAELRITARQHARARRLSRELVEENARLCTLAQDAWVEARDARDFAVLAPWLERVVEGKRREAFALADGGEPYDALLDEYEPGMRSATLAPMFDELAREIAPIVRAEGARPSRVDRSLLHRPVPIARQRALALELAAAMGFDFAGGRLDTAAHPSTIRVGPGDVRLTTRFREDSPFVGLISTLHEVGHGLYDQGLPRERWGTPLGETLSLGLHESQARLFESLIGGGRAFWRFALPKLRAAYAPAYDDVDESALYDALTQVEPTLLRVRADAVTYDLHIAVRFELEQALISGALSIGDLPAAWNERYEAMLGVRPHDDAEGVLQDGHWASGMFGYFPTYTIGNLVAAQLLEGARAALGDLDEAIARGELAPLVLWLRANVHAHGARYDTAELVLRATGRPLDAAAHVRQLRQRL